jgi:hypothetical protein
MFPLLFCDISYWHNFLIIIIPRIGLSVLACSVLQFIMAFLCTVLVRRVLKGPQGQRVDKQVLQFVLWHDQMESFFYCKNSGDTSDFFTDSLASPVGFFVQAASYPNFAAFAASVHPYCCWKNRGMDTSPSYERARYVGEGL